MARLGFKAAASVTALAVCSCGSATRQPPAAASGPGSALAGDAKLQLTPVAAPAGLLGIGRLKNPARLAQQTAAWADVPIDPRALLAQELPGIEDVLALESPVEVALLLDPTSGKRTPEFLAAASVGLTSLDATLEFARKHGQPVRQVEPGVHRVGDGSRVACVAAAALGPDPARLICGDDREDVDALAPYLARGLPLQQLGSADLFIELDVEPLRARYAKEIRQIKTLGVPFLLHHLQLDVPRFDRALADAVHGLADELVALADDLDKVTVELRLDEANQKVELASELGFRKRGSWVAESFEASARRASPPPPLFWQLPADASSAGFGTGTDAKRTARIRQTLVELVDGLLSSDPAIKPAGERLAALLEQVWFAEAPNAYAHGQLEASPPDRPEHALKQALGWYVWGVEAPPAALEQALDGVADLFADPALRKRAVQELKLAAADLPTLRPSPFKGATLPANSKHYRLTLPAKLVAELQEESKGDKPAQPLELHALLVPAKERTFIGFSADLRVLTEKLAQAASAAGERGLAGRQGLEPLRQTQAVSGGFFTLESLASGSVFDDDAAFSKDLGASLTGMPHHGETPMVFTTTVDPGSTLSVRFALQVPKAVFEDVASGVATMGARRHSGP